MIEPSGAASDIPAESRLDILDLYARQVHAIDGGDGIGWASTFTPDGVFHSPTYALTAHGTEELIAFANTSNGAALARGEQFRHLVTAVALDRVGDDRIDARAYLTIIAASSTGIRIDRSIVMRDELVRHEGKWLFRLRNVQRD